MSEKFHRAYVCDEALVAALSEASTIAVRACDGAPLRSFWTTHRDARQRAIDGFRTALVLDKLRRACKSLAALRKTKLAGQSEVDALVALAMAKQDERRVSQTAQDSLHARAARIARLIEIKAPDEIIFTDVRYALASFEALDAGDLEERLRNMGLSEEPSDYELVEQCLYLCRVAGRSRDIGLDDRHREGFVEGRLLVPPQLVADAPASLFQRTLERFHVYADTYAAELLAEDRRRFCSSLNEYDMAHCGSSSGLTLAADAVEALAGRKKAMARALARYAGELRRAAAEGHVVVEWIAEW